MIAFQVKVGEIFIKVKQIILAFMAYLKIAMSYRVVVIIDLKAFWFLF
jgi:hypothetical protein